MLGVMLVLAATVASASGAPAEAKAVALGEPFRLKAGQSARIEADGLEVGFERVLSDSRCRKGEQCIWEGDAAVSVWMQKDGQTKETYELHTSPKMQKSPAEGQGYALRLAGLEPHPVSGRTTAPEDYVATLEVTKGSSAVAAP